MELQQITQLTTTCGSLAAAEQLVAQVIQKRLAACGQIDCEVRSRYHWQGTVATDTEYRCTFKTSLALAEACAAFLLAEHAYETPELLLETVSASAAYAEWVAASVVPPASRYRFDIRLHHRPSTAVEEGFLDSAGERLRTIVVAPGSQAEPMHISFDAALEAIGELPGCYVEPDGAILWTGSDEHGRWQVDGNLFDRGGRVVFATLSGSCPVDAFDQLLACFGWPDEPLMMEVVRAAAYLAEDVFRRHASLG